MDQEGQAKKLLIESYKVSAGRIQQALAGALEVHNSRNPADPPTGQGEVVGLCGQSGRHPYFRIPIRSLNEALDAIREVGQSSSDIQRATEELGTICSDLRQRTFFDSGTGCVNDRIPSMVPLLPPEEIWFERRELPLDVWRLISFELDLVSSAVSQAVDIPDFQFGAFNEAALTFRLLMKQLGNRRVRFEAVPEALKAPWSYMLGSSRNIEVSLARLFFEFGSLLTPLSSRDLTRYYGALRYREWISDRGVDLLVRKRFDQDSVDSRYKGLFSEELAIGLMAVVLADVFEAAPINNTVDVVPRSSIRSGQPIADFIARCPNPANGNTVTIIAESKGSIKNSVSKKRRDRAKVQVATTSLAFQGSTDKLGLAFASTLYFDNQGKRTNCTVIDPPDEGEEDLFDVDPVLAWRAAFAKTFRFVGLETASQQALRGDPVVSLRPIDADRREERPRGRREDRDEERRRERREERREDRRAFTRWRRASLARQMLGSEIVLDVGETGVVIDASVQRVLEAGLQPRVVSELEKILQHRRRSREGKQEGATFVSSLGVGMVFYDELERELGREG